MRTILDVQKQLLPDLLDVMRKRVTILQYVMHHPSTGRRTLAASLGMSERMLRAEVDYLKLQGLVDVDSKGIHISAMGMQVMTEMEPWVHELFGLTDLEEQIRDYFQLKQVVIVPGDSDQSDITKKELGRAGASLLRQYISRDDIVAVAGGSTMAEIADGLMVSSDFKGACFVPARGGLGERVELQANSIVSTMAKKTGGSYRLLHVPDHLSEEAYQSLMMEPNIREIIAEIRKARIVLHGIGDAIVMAERRKVDAQSREELLRDGALAEAFGYYFDKDGHVVHNMSTVGLRLEDIMQTEVVIGVAGGLSKAEAIRAVLRFGHEDVLVTDEAAATRIVSLL